MDERLQKVIDGIKDGSISAEMGALLSCYYDEYIEELCYGGPSDFGHDGLEYPHELTLPLEERSGGIAEALAECVSLGVTMNGEDVYDAALETSVAWADAAVTEFLIRNGSDPSVWPDMEEAYEMLPVVSNYYYEDIDIGWFNEYWKRSNEYGMALLHTAKVLATLGNLGPWGGLCLKIDEDNITSLRDPQYRY